MKRLISTQRNDINGAITAADRQMIILANKVEELGLDDEEHDEEGNSSPTDDRADALRQLEEERKALNTAQKLLEELLAKSHEQAIGKAALIQSGSSTVNFGDNNSGFQAGSIAGGVSGISFGK